ncbi:restriction endonuclease subunit S [Methylomonas methanica]|uniref:Type I restriction modification DNA specificity domain-containing protein n=1 Tax=Methylomonas methanica TaxID=421 RepID=A0A177M3I0_METMH|nr:restriction endonuclease subunit S [Methylomonas methanica]OAH99914.1 hypothetical protein A1332_19190 [Methylomonas methanica]
MTKFTSYPKYKLSGLDCFGEIPEDWKVIPIKFSLDMPITDGPHSTPTFYPEGVPFLSAESVKNDRLDFDRKRGYISVEDHEIFSKKYKPKFGDVYMVKSGATTGAVARVHTHDEFNIWSPLAVLRPHAEKASSDFIFFVLKSKPFFYSVEQSWSYGTQQNIGMGVISNIRMALPPLEEQQAIARVGAYCGNVHFIKEPSWVTDNALRVKIISDEVSAEFLILALEAIGLNDYANKNAQPLITGEMVKSKRIALPSSVEQVAICRYTGIVEDQIEKQTIKTKSAIDKLREYRSALITNAVTGKIDVREWHE